MHLSNGDYILIGPEKFIDIRISRMRDNELWYLSRKPGSKPVKSRMNACTKAPQFQNRAC